MFASYPGVQLDSVAEVDQFYGVIEGKLKTLPGKVYVIADLQDFSVDARVAEAFGQRMAAMHENYVRGLVRYNVGEGFPKLSIRLASLKAGRPSHIVASRDEALAL